MRAFQGPAAVRSGNLADVSVWMACVWGLLGAGAVEAHQLHSDIGRVKNYPWRARGEVPLGPYLTALVIRLALGVGMAAIFGASGQAGGPVGVTAVGVAAPKLLEQLAGRGLAVLESQHPETLVTSATRTDPTTLPAEPRQPREEQNPLDATAETTPGRQRHRLGPTERSDDDA